MSLVGSLEDLGLGDILQIISLSRKSGVLMLRSEQGDGQILFRDGRVTGALCKGGPTDLRGLLVGGGAISDAEFASAVRAARERGAELDDALRELPALAGERLEAVRTRNIERAAFAMFAWPTGEFSFDVRDDVDTIDPGLCVAGGIDAQYLAIEGARLRDEEVRDAREAADVEDPASFADLGAELRDEPPPHDTEGELEAIAEELAPDEALEAEALAEPIAEVVAEPADEPTPAAAEVIPPAAVEPGHAAEPAGPRSTTPVVAVDADLAVLEWLSSALRGEYERVHIFQKTELAIARIRQYLLRREMPVVVLSDNAPPDPNSGARTPDEIIARLEAQAPRMPVLRLVPVTDGGRSEGVDGAAAKPSPSDLYSPRRADAVEELAAALRSAVAGRARRAAEPAAEPHSVDPQGLRRLKQVSAELREAAPRGQIIPVVLGFAAEHFSRVAMFLVRDELAVGMIQSGLGRAAGPDDVTLRDLAIRVDEPAWFRAVLDKGSSVRGPASDEGDRRLVRLLGSREPPEAYVAPLESGDRVVAILYADNLPEGKPLPDTAALEIVLHEAGLTLDRAALERQLAETESE